jgi:hypothetical protein
MSRVVEKSSGQILGLFVMSHLTWRGLNSKPEHFSCFIFFLVSFGESRLLISWCVGGRCDMTGSDEDCGRIRKPSAKDRGWSHRTSTRWTDDREVG